MMRLTRRLCIGLGSGVLATTVWVGTAGAVLPPPKQSVARPSGSASLVRLPLAQERAIRKLAPSAAQLVDVHNTGAVRVLGRRDTGALSGPADGPAREIGRKFLARERRALGLDAADLKRLEPAGGQRLRTGGRVVRWRAEYKGLPLEQGQVRVAVDDDGRVLRVMSSLAPGFEGLSPVPAIDAATAMQHLADEVHSKAPKVKSTGSGPERPTVFVGGDRGSLAIYGDGPDARLGWHLLHRAKLDEFWAATVDAQTGAVVSRHNLARHAAEATVYHDYPSKPGDQPHTVDLEDAGYLEAGASELTGPFAEQFSELNGDGIKDPGEETPRRQDGTFNYPFTPVNAPNGQCAPLECGWDHEVADSWKTNLEQSGTQAFWFVNNFHDHLESAPIGFDEASGNFENDDRLRLMTTYAPNEPGARNNGGIIVPPDGTSPEMALLLFSADQFGQTPFRDVNPASSADIVYHEYTHGLNNRLLVNALGESATNGLHGGAIDEALADWYGLDYLVRTGERSDQAGVAGEVRMGDYVTANPGPDAIRTESIDCPIDADAQACPGSDAAGPGGYTFDDITKIAGYAEIHADGEIWGQTMWDLRTALVEQLGSQQAGSDAAEALITDALRLAPEDPSFLDMRDAILAADTAAGGGSQDLIWQVFAHRGMGYAAYAADSFDQHPFANYDLPPSADAPRGTVHGVVTSADSGLPLAGAKVGVIGKLDEPSSGLVATTDASGAYSLKLPAGIAFKELDMVPPDGYQAVPEASFKVDAGSVVTRNFTVRRDWAAVDGGATIIAANSLGNPWDSYNLESINVLDRRFDTEWWAYNENYGTIDHQPPYVTIELPRSIRVDQIRAHQPLQINEGSDPALTKKLRVEGSADRKQFFTVAEGELEQVPGKAFDLNGTSTRDDVRYLRLTLLEAFDPTFGSNRLAELEVFGKDANQLPRGQLKVTPSGVKPGGSVTLDASSFKDPDSRITGYRWDFDGDGKVDAQTPGPKTKHVYAKAGTFKPSVAAVDFRGGTGSASATLKVGVTTAAPTLSISGKGRKGRLAVNARCFAVCELSVRLRIAKATAKSLGLGTRVVAKVSRNLPAGNKRITVRLSKKTRTALTKRHRKSLKVSVTAVVKDSGGLSATATRKATIKRR